MQPPQRPRTFLVANIADPARRLFVSKSILDDSLPPVGGPSHPFPYPTLPLTCVHHRSCAVCSRCSAHLRWNRSSCSVSTLADVLTLVLFEQPYMNVSGSANARLLAT